MADDDRGQFGIPGIGSFRSRDFTNPGLSADLTHPPEAKRLTPENIDQYNILIGGEEVATPEAVEIIRHVLPLLLHRFLLKNRKYALAQTGHDLGVKGIIPDINRKTSVIIDRLWNGSPTVDEDTVEVMEDLVGHLLLALAKVRIEGQSHA